MANTTFNGPVRSENGFQEWNGSAWVPVAGGGGGGTTFVDISGANQYADSWDGSTPLLGNIVQLPALDVGQTCSINYFDGSVGSPVWAFEVPPLPGVDFGIFTNDLVTINQWTGSYVPTVYSSPIGSETGVFYFYGSLYSTIQFIRAPDYSVPGFGTVAVYKQVGVCVLNGPPLTDLRVYPASTLPT